MKKAAIIGGSMSGLFAANFLKKINWDYWIHEMVPEPLSGRGAGIATYDELAKLVKLTTGYNKSLGTSCNERIVLNKQNEVISKINTLKSSLVGNIYTMFYYQILIKKNIFLEMNVLKFLKKIILIL